MEKVIENIFMIPLLVARLMTSVIVPVPLLRCLCQLSVLEGGGQTRTPRAVPHASI